MGCSCKKDSRAKCYCKKCYKKKYYKKVSHYVPYYKTKCHRYKMYDHGYGGRGSDSSSSGWMSDYHKHGYWMHDSSGY